MSDKKSKTIPIGETAVGESVELDLFRFIQTRGMIQASSGGGKSWLVRVIAEKTLAHEIPVWIIDPEGEYTTLREKFDVVIFGSVDADLPLDESTLLVALPELFGKGIPLVFDLSEVSLEEKQRVAAQVCNFLLSVSKADQKPLLVACDEAQILAPEREITPSGKALSDIASRGRKRALGLLVATQRLSALNKNLTTQLQNRFVGFCREDIEVARAAELIGKKNAALLPDFEPGDFFAVGGALNFRHAVRFHSAKVETTHPDAALEDFSNHPSPVASTQLSELIAVLREKLTAEAEKAAEAEPPQIWTAEEIERDFEINIQEFNHREQWLEEQEEALDLRKLHIKRREEEITAREKQFVDLTASFWQRLETVFGEARALLDDRLDSIKKEFHAVLRVPTGILDTKIETLAAQPAETEISESATIENDRQKEAPLAQKTSPKSPKSANLKLTPAQQRIINSLATFEQLGLIDVDRSNVAVFAEASPKSSAFDQNLRELRNKGLIEYSSGRVCLTSAGAGSADNNLKPITGNDELLAAWRRYLPAKQGAILTLLAKDFEGRCVSRVTIAQRTDQSPTSSAFDGHLRELRKLGLVEYCKTASDISGARATKLLFPFSE